MVERNYKYMLRRGGRKEICPCCGQRRFVPYVLMKDGRTLAGAEFGRCDREQNCGYQKYPTKDVKIDESKIVAREIKPMQPLRFYNAAVHTDIHTNLFEYVAQLLGVGHAMRIWRRYKIGADGKRTIFWQIAADGSVRAGKSIPYKANGHRDKEDPYPANWLHKQAAWRGCRTGEELQQCYFGEHLLKEHPTDKVVIVESEKTAAVMSELSSGWVWLASGGSHGLKNEVKNEVLQGREVWLLPDNGMYWNWAALAREHGWHIFDEIEKYPTFEGCDVLDLLEAGSLGKELLKNCVLWQK